MGNSKLFYKKQRIEVSLIFLLLLNACTKVSVSSNIDGSTIDAENLQKITEARKNKTLLFDEKNPPENLGFNTQPPSQLTAGAAIQNTIDVVAFDKNGEIIKTIEGGEIIVGPHEDEYCLEPSQEFESTKELTSFIEGKASLKRAHFIKPGKKYLKATLTIPQSGKKITACSLAVNISAASPSKIMFVEKVPQTITSFDIRLDNLPIFKVSDAYENEILGQETVLNFYTDENCSNLASDFFLTDFETKMNSNEFICTRALDNGQTYCSGWIPSKIGSYYIQSHLKNPFETVKSECDGPIQVN